MSSDNNDAQTQLAVNDKTKRTREEKGRRKELKTVDQVLKSLGTLDNPEEKLRVMCQKYAEIFNDHRLLQNSTRLSERKYGMLAKEKEQLQTDHSKAILTRSRLENLCRELQRQNKAIKEECILKMREEEEKKKEVMARFQNTLTELGNLLALNNDANAKLKDDNMDVTTKLKSVCEKYELKEQHVEKLAKQMKLEMQLADAKLAKAKMDMALEKETLLQEKQQLLAELTHYRTQVEDLKGNEMVMRDQIQMYNDKYDDFHKALIQSNDAISGFKIEMERMTKQMKKLEKETVTWKTRYESAHRTLLEMTEEKLKSDQLACVANRRLVALQGLCRSLQAQCTSLRNQKEAEPGAATNESDHVEAIMNEVEEQLNQTSLDLNDDSPCPRVTREEAPAPQELPKCETEDCCKENGSQEKDKMDSGDTANSEIPEPPQVQSKKSKGKRKNKNKT